MSETRYIISDAAKMIDVEPHVLRYWEEELGMEIPRNEMGHRYYTDREVRLFTQVRDLKEKGFQLKAIKMILSTLSEDMKDNNIISLDAVRKNMNDNDTDLAVHTKADGAMEMGCAKTQEDKHGKAQEGTRGEDMAGESLAYSGSYKACDDEESLHKKILAVRTDMNADLYSRSSGTLSETDQEMVQAISAQEKMKHFKYIMDGIMMQALKKNNQILQEEFAGKVIKEMDYLFRMQDERAEERFRNLDEMIRSKQKGRRQAAAAKGPDFGKNRSKKKLFGKRDLY